MSDQSIGVFVSYVWEVEARTGVVDKLETLCQARGIKLLRDDNELKQGQLISRFMNRLAGGEHIITVFSQEYFKSEYCMYELLTIYQRGDLHQRVHPVLVDDTVLSDFFTQTDLAAYWKAFAAKARDQLQGIDPAAAHQLWRKVKLYEDIHREIITLMNFAGDMKVTRLEVLEKSDYRQLLDRIKPHRTAGAAPLTSGRSSEKGVTDTSGNKPELPWATVVDHDCYGLYADLFINEVVSQRFRWIKPGTFWMGSPDSESERRENETRHQVTLTQGYWLADTACTQAFWLAVIGSKPSRFTDNVNNPVEQVSWDDVQQFIDTLNTLSPRLKACLPSEAQWEYACRAGTVTVFSLGDNISPEQVNYNGDYPYNGGKKGVYRKKTLPVQSLPANPWGLYEMHGNVWEWCQDQYGDYPAGPVKDPLGETGTLRVLRGGSWLDYGLYARSAVRDGNRPGRRNGYFGFRLALGH